MFSTLSEFVIVLFLALVVGLFLSLSFKSWLHAKRRARRLLHDMLTPEQCRQLRWHGYLDVPSPSMVGRVYRVPRTKGGFIQVLEHGKAVMRLCVQPTERLPDADVVVLHKLMIEANEESYLQKANKYRCIDH